MYILYKHKFNLYIIAVPPIRVVIKVKSKSRSMRNYNSISLREPVPRQILSDPEDGLVYCTHGSAEVRVCKKENKNKGLTMLQTAVFIAGEMAGSGVLALPQAIVNSGWIGLILLAIFCFNAAYGGTRLGECWNILEERYPEYKNKTRNPYATIAQRAVGKWASVLVSFSIQFTLFGAGTVYLLLASQILQELLTNFIPNISFCYWFIAIAILLMPLMWLGSPKDFRFAGIIALFTTLFSCVLYFTQITLDGMSSTIAVEHRPHDFNDFFLAFGTLIFSFGGASTFPTIQNDMENKRKFSFSVIIAFSVILFLYLPIAAGGFLVYGESILPNMVLSLSDTYLVKLANILMIIHLVFAFLIVINPVSQELEEIFEVPHHYNWRRCVLRSLMLILMGFIGETIPRFGKILSLVGGSTITLLTFVFPPYFYMRLCNQKSPLWPERYIPSFIKLYLWELIFIGLVGGIASTYSAINSIIGPNSFTLPCYWT